MTFTREDWQSDLLNKTNDVMPRLKQMGITSGYAIIAASALLPVLITGSGFFPLLVSLVGNVGANLIANQIQDAKDEVDIARKLQNLSVDDPLNIQIRLLLEKLDAFNVVSQGLQESDWTRLERLLDEKLAKLSANSSRDLATYAPIIRETVTNAQVRQIALQYIANLWWASKIYGKANVSLSFIPTVFYRAKCFAVVQVTHKDQYNSQSTITSKEATNPFPVRLILFHEDGLQKNNPLVEELYKSINGLTRIDQIDWHENSFARWGYRVFASPIRNPYSPSSFSDGIRDAEKNIGYWFGDKNQYDKKPSKWVVQKEKIVDEARTAVEEILDKKYDSMLGKTLLRARFNDEELDFAQYPFYFYEMTSPGYANIVIDGLTGDVRYLCMKPNLKAMIVYSIGTLLLIAALLLFLVVIINLIAKYLWN